MELDLRISLESILGASNCVCASIIGILWYALNYTMNEELASCFLILQAVCLISVGGHMFSFQKLSIGKARKQVLNQNGYILSNASL